MAFIRSIAAALCLLPSLAWGQATFAPPPPGQTPTVDAVVKSLTTPGTVTAGTLAGGAFTISGIGAVGAARKTDGSYGWLEGLRQYSLALGQFASVSTRGAIGGVFASRTSDSNKPAGDQGTIGAEFIVNNDDAVTNKFGFAMYSEVYRQAGAGTSHAWESDAVNYGSVVEVLPNTLTNVGITTNNWQACGGGYATGLNPCSAATVILNNGAPYRKGIVFGSNAIDGANLNGSGTSSEGVAIAFSKNHRMNWYDVTGNVLGYVVGTGTATSNQTGIVLSPAGMLIGNAGEYGVFNIINNNAGVNYGSIANSTAGNPLPLVANGTDANIGWTITPKGTGTTTLGAATAPVNVLGSLSVAGALLPGGAIDYASSAPGTGSTAIASRLYRGQQFNWYSATTGGSLVGYVRADSTNTANPTGIKLDSVGGMFANGGEYPVFRAANVTNGLNYPQTSNSAAGATVSYGAAGSDANISVSLTGKGTSGALTGAFVRTADPSTTDIPSGQCADWSNTTAATFKHVCNFGGTLRSVALQ